MARYLPSVLAIGLYMLATAPPAGAQSAVVFRAPYSLILSLASFGDDVLVGANPAYATFEGKAYLIDGVTGALLRSFSHPAGLSWINEGFGRAVAAVGTNVLVGAPSDSTAGYGTGRPIS
jgi:hypothetical protein